MRVQKHVLSSLPSGNLNTVECPLGLSASLTSPKKLWRMSYVALKTYIDIGLDDVGCFSNSWNHHVKLLDEVLNRLKSNGFTVNPHNASSQYKKLTGLAIG